MRMPIRTVLVLAAAAGLLWLFLSHVDLGVVMDDIGRARPGWLVLALASTFATLAIRALRWQYLLEPLGTVGFGNAFRATAVGFAANAVLPARAGEVIRPYFLARHEPVSATGAFATVVLERLLDTMTVLILFAGFVVFFGRSIAPANAGVFRAVTWAGLLAGITAAFVLALLFVLAGNPARIGRAFARVETRLPAALGASVARAAETFATGLGVVRRPGRLAVALVWSFPLWLAIASGIWAVSVAFGLHVPFTGTFLLVAILVVGVAVPTPGAIGGFHEAFRLGVTTFYGAPNEVAVGAALVLHAVAVGPSLLLGLAFAAQDGLNLSTARRLAGASPRQGTAIP